MQSLRHDDWNTGCHCTLQHLVNLTHIVIVGNHGGNSVAVASFVAGSNKLHIALFTCVTYAYACAYEVSNEVLSHLSVIEAYSWLCFPCGTRCYSTLLSLRPTSQRLVALPLQVSMATSPTSLAGPTSLTRRGTATVITLLLTAVLHVVAAR